MLTKALGVVTAISVLTLNQSVVIASSELKASPKIPANCQLLKEVSTGQTSIRKKIENIGIGNNFNVDFAVPSDVKFKTYKAMMTPENDAKYEVTINLKYSDGSTGTAFQKKAEMTRGKEYSLSFTSATGGQPYQVNFKISGANNHAYTISIMACK